MGRHNKRNSAAVAAVVPMIPKKVDPAMQSLMDYGDNLKVYGGVSRCGLSYVALPLRLKSL